MLFQISSSCSLSFIRSNCLDKNLGKKVAPWAALLLLLAVSLWLRWRYVWVEPLSFDEGHWLMFGVLVNAGYPAYSETFVGIPPLALLIIQLGAKLFSPTNLALRYPMMLFSLVGLISIFWIFYSWKHNLSLLAGLLAAVFLSFDADAFRGSGSIMAEVPAVSMAIFSLTLVLQYRHTHRWFWLVLSGAAFTLSLALKVFVVFLPAVIGWVLLLDVLKSEQKSISEILQRLIIRGGLWGAGAIITLAFFMIFYDPWIMYEQVYVFRLAVRQVYLTEGAEGVSTWGNIVKIGTIMLERAPLLLGAVLGTIIGGKRRLRDTGLWWLWLILAALLMTTHAPLRQRYSVMLLPPLAALSGLAGAYGVLWLFSWFKAKGAIRFAWALSSLLLAALIAWTLVIPIRSAYAHLAVNTFAEDMRLETLDAIEYAHINTATSDCLITDDQRFALRAGRLVPPALSETAKGLLMTGWVSAEDIIREAKVRDCPMVVYELGRFDQFLPHLRDQLRDLYFLELTFNDDITIYAEKKHVVQQPSISLKTQVGEDIVLNGIDLTPAPWQPGQEVQVVTYWTALDQPDRAYKIFLQMRNQQGETVASFDHFPFSTPGNRYKATPNLDAQSYSPEDIAIYPQQGMLPTNAWPVGNTLREVTTFRLPTTLSAGTYDLFIGMYDPATSSRLPIYSASRESDEFLIASVKIIAPY